MPQGTGILLLAADTNDVSHNEVERERLATASPSANFCLGTNTPPEACAQLDIQPDADGNRITHNEVDGQRGAPRSDLPPVFAVDLAWDTTGVGNCWAKNEFGTSFPDPLPRLPLN